VNSAITLGGKDFGLIDLVPVDQVEKDQLKEMMEKTEKLIERIIRSLVLNKDEFLKLRDRLNID